jgi:hypothetical protein
MIKLKMNIFGKSIYSKVKILKGTVVCQFSGKTIDYKTTLTLGNKESFAFQVSSGHYLFLDAPARFFNHSCEPNCGVNGRLELIALCDIEPNEELKYDYSTTMMERHWTMECKCNSDKCRKLIADFDKLPVSTRQYYIQRGVVQPFILEMVKYEEKGLRKTG